MSAAWTAPAAGTKNVTNTEPPLNTSSSNQIKTGSLGVSSLSVVGGSIGIANGSPSVEFNDTSDVAGVNNKWWLHSNAYGSGPRIHFLYDRNNNGTWDDGSASTFVQAGGAVNGTQDVIATPGNVWSGKYCNIDGSKCATLDGLLRDNIQRFVSAYYALRSDPSFSVFWGSQLPNHDLQFCGNPVNSLYRCGTGWKVIDPSVEVMTDRGRVGTYDKICSYMMDGGKWIPGTDLEIYDSGSDSGNNAIYWNGSGAGTIPHDWNDFHDARKITCIGGAVTSQGQWWLASNRPESYDRGGNKYPVPPLR
jgi:hypothetical protein